LSRSLVASSLAIFADASRAAQSNAAAATPLPRREQILVAFMLGDRSNVIDTAGPWEVFQDVMLHDEAHAHPFELFTVGPANAKVVKMTGGLRIQPHYTIENAPQP